MRGFQKYESNWILTMAFWATCKIAQPIQPIWQHFLPCLSLPSKSHRENSISSIYFGIPWSNRQEKYCQMLEIFFPYFTTLETYRAQSTFFRDTLYLVTNKVNKFDRKGRRWILLLSCLLQPQNIQVSIRQTLQSVHSNLSSTQFNPAVI